MRINAKNNKNKKNKRTFSVTCELISATFCVAIPPYFTALSVALLANLLADDERNEKPYKDDFRKKLQNTQKN